MKGIKRFVLLGTALVLAGSAASAQQRDKDEGLFDQLVRECKLTEDQQAAVKEKIKARDEVLAKWDKENAEKVQAAKDAVKEATSKGDDEAKKKAGADTKALRTAREEAAAEATKAVFSVLTEDQKAVWKSYELYLTTSSRYRKAELTEEQQAKIKAACAAVQKEMAEAGEDTKAARELASRLRWGIEVFILTPEQRKTVQAPKKKSP
jgi:Spy/CpxP family protein refolding chaperone